METNSPFVKQRAPALGLGLLIVLVYGRSLGGAFLSWDDIQHFKLNAALNAGDIARFWRAPYYGLYIPVTYTAWTLLHRLSEAAWLPHAMNLALHLLNTYFVYEIASGLTSIASRGLNHRAFFAAALFALHPLQVETVAWISGGRDLLMATFALGAVRALRRQRPYLAFALYVLGLLSKPSLGFIAPALLLSDVGRLRGRALLLWCAGGALALGGAWWIQSPFTAARLPHVSWRATPILALDAIGFYARQFIFPYPLSADYGRTPNFVLNSLNAYPYLGFVTLATLTFLYAARPRHRPSLRYLLFSLVVLLPVLGFVPFEAQVQSTVFDRYLYLPLLGVALSLATWPAPATIQSAPTSSKYKIKSRDGFARAAIGATFLVSAFLSASRVDVWLSNRALFSDILRKHPENYFANVNFGIDELERGQVDSAASYLKQARVIEPRLALAPANLFHVYWMQHDLAALRHEGEPLVTDETFLAFNQHEPQALALLFRMVARERASLLEISGARDLYDRAAAYDPTDLDLRREQEAFRTEHP